MADQHRLQWGDLSVEANRIGDRFDWRILWEPLSASALPLLQSVPSPIDTAWPPFPPLQELAQESHSDTEVLLGVGMAGKSHWSVSVDRRQPPHQPAMVFDFACRLSGSPAFLGACWMLGEGLHAIPPASLNLPWLLRRNATTIATLTPDNHTSLRLEGNQVQLIPNLGTGGIQGTVRWGFRIARPEASQSPNS
jgi:hypothetical protein